MIPSNRGGRLIFENGNWHNPTGRSTHKTLFHSQNNFKCGENEGFVYKDVTVTMDEALKAWTSKLEKVFPTKAVKGSDAIETKLYEAKDIYVCRNKVAKPTVFIPVFPGTNCEYDSTIAFERAGASVVTSVFRNLSAGDIRDSVDEFARAIAQAQIIMFPGGANLNSI